MRGEIVRASCPRILFSAIFPRMTSRSCEDPPQGPGSTRRSPSILCYRLKRQISPAAKRHPRNRRGDRNEGPVLHRRRWVLGHWAGSATQSRSDHRGFRPRKTDTLDAPPDEGGHERGAYPRRNRPPRRRPIGHLRCGLPLLWSVSPAVNWRRQWLIFLQG